MVEVTATKEVELYVLCWTKGKLLDYKHDEIKDYFKNWIIDQGSSNQVILNFLKEHKEVSIKNTDDNCQTL